MKVEVQDAERSRKALSIELPPEVFNKSYERYLADFAKSAKLPGFRKGKAPLSLVEKQYQHELKVKTLEKVINDAIETALKDNKIIALSIPHIEDLKFGDDKAISFKVFVDVFPTFEISKYTGFDFEMPIEKVTDEDISKELEALRLEHAVYEPKEDDAVTESMDLVTLDYTERLDDIVEEAKDFTFEIDNNNYLKDFNDQIKGMKKNEEKTFSVKYPNEHPEGRFAGKEVNYTVKVKEIKKEILPEIDDDFAKEINEQFNSLDDLKKDIMEKLQNFKKSQAREKLIVNILNKIIQENPFDIPQTLIDKQAEQMLNNLINYYKNIYGDGFVKNVPLEKMKNELLPKAESQIKYALIVNKISTKENILVTDEEIDEKVKEYATQKNMDYQKLKEEWQKHNVLQNLKDNILMDKVYEFLIKSNNVSEKYLEKENMDKDKTENNKQQEEKK